MVHKIPFCTDCSIFVDRQSLLDQKVIIVQTNPQDGSLRTGGRCPASIGPLNVVGVNLGCLDLEDALDLDRDSELLRTGRTK